MRAMQPNLEQLAQTTEPQMVRARFDEHNLDWAFVVSWLFGIASFILVPMSFSWKEQRLPHATAGIIDALLTLFLIGAMSELRRVRRRDVRPPRAYARLVGRNLSAWLVALFVSKFAVLVYFAVSDKAGWMVWGFVFPITTIPLWLLLRQRVTLSGVLLAILAVAFVIAPVNRKTNRTG